MYYKISSVDNKCSYFIEDKEWGKVYKIKDATLVNGYYLIKDGFFIKETLHENFNRKWVSYWKKERGNSFGGRNSEEIEFGKNRNSLYLNKRSNKKSFLNIPVILFEYMYSYNFQHFLLTALPRLSILFNKNFDNLKILIRKDTSKYQIDYISKIFGKERILIIEPDLEYEVATIYLIKFYQWTNYKTVIKFFDKIKYYFKIKDSFKIKNNKLTEYIYISRSDALGRRPLLNNDEFKKIISKYNFSDILFSNIDLEEKIEILDKTKLLIGVTGSGLSNAIFLPKGSSILYIEHPKFLIHKEIISFCKYKGIKLKVLREKNIFFKKLLLKFNSLINTTIRIKENRINSEFWEIDINKLENFIKKNI